MPPLLLLLEETPACRDLWAQVEQLAVQHDHWEGAGPLELSWYCIIDEEANVHSLRRWCCDPS